MMKITKIKKLITHNGSFHADDIFACATLCLVLEKKGEEFKIIRARDEEIIKTGDYVFDVGGIYDEKINRFDHHQKDGAGARENGIPYSSFGLVWKKFGKDLCGSEEIAERVEKRIVQQVDANDNGFNIIAPIIPNVVPYGIHDVVFAFNPSFKEENPDFDKAFLKAGIFIKNLLLKEIEEAKDQEYIHKYIFRAISNRKDNSPIIVLDEYVPREKIWFESVDYSDILFIVAPRDIKKESWKLIVLPENIGFFEFRKLLPKSWAGLRGEELQKITRTPDALFAHRNLFMAIVKSKQGAVRLAELALLEPSN